MGTDGRIKSFPPITPPAGNLISHLTAYLDTVAAEQAEDGENRALGNILDEIQALTAQTIYKLRVLK